MKKPVKEYKEFTVVTDVTIDRFYRKNEKISLFDKTLIKKLLINKIIK